MSLFGLISNTVEGVTQASLGTVKLAVSPVTMIVKEDAVEDAIDDIEEGLDKIGDDDE